MTHVRTIPGRSTMPTMSGSIDEAKAYVPRVQARRTEPVEEPKQATPAARGGLPADHRIYDDPQIRELLAALPGATIRKVRLRGLTTVEDEGDDGG